MTAAVVVPLPIAARPMAIPVPAKLVIKGTSSSSRLRPARRMAQAIAAALPGPCNPRRGRCRLRREGTQKAPAEHHLGHRLRKDAALHALPPARTGKRGRPREKGDRLGSLAALASATASGQVTVTRYVKTAAISAAAVTCLRPSAFGTRQVTVVLIRDKPGTGYHLALVTADLDAGPAAAIERYAARWSIEVAIQDARQVFGAGQARTARVVERTVPFQLACQAITTTRYATAGHDPADVASHGARAPWYTTKSQPSTADMLAKLRRALIAAKYRASRPDQPTPEEINIIRPAWEDAAA